ncbi:hypothetical protein SAMN05444392_1112 [Seinonella peptonophila]|uniref:Uncharacterized protein n=1 Tax=Seinonella peptonophila TaxID=112248 RepID=A0A1M4ZWB9_9BACL|nr:hypothetical protein [Seinonella peptonophila]SHF22042.1 hypothetical protein SAMN05444392_1112 [Seinonella peptonophila]
MDEKQILDNLYKQAKSFSFRYDPYKESPDENEILLGRGHRSSKGLILSQHLTKWLSISSYVYHMDQDEINKWIPSYRVPTKQITFFLKDLSPDTVLSYLLWSIRINQLPFDIPKIWIDYVDNWKRGDVSLTGEPFQSWGCLQSALAHTYFSHGNEPKDIEKSFLACLKFLISLLKQGVIPYQVVDVDYFPEYQIAKSFLTYEYHRYVNSYKSGTKLQLVLPIVDSNKSAVIDAFISTEKAYIGAIKSFVRSDQTRPWLKMGFSLMAIHQPMLKGTGNDMVISIDPSKQIHLEQFWTELEKLETEKWKGQRPMDENQLAPMYPWYYDKDFSLVAAPKKAMEQSYGSKLTWNDVVNTLWKLYHPAKTLQVQPYLEDGTLGNPCSVYECQPVDKNIECNKQLFACRWSQYDLQESLINSPTMKQLLASCASGVNRLPTVYELPSEQSFDFKEIPGGYAVIHANGVFLLDDWQDDSIPFHDYQNEFHKLETRLMSILKMKKEIKEKINYIAESMRDYKTLKSQHLTHLNHWMAILKVELRKKIIDSNPSINYDLQSFYRAIEKRWGIEEQLKELYDSVSEIENIVRGYVDTRTNRLVSNITVFGFPIVLFGGLFQFIFQGIKNPPWLSLWGIHWLGLLLYLIFSSVGIVGVFFFQKKINQGLNHKSNPSEERFYNRISSLNRFTSENKMNHDV